MEIHIAINNGLGYYEKYQKYLNRYSLKRLLIFFSLLLLPGLIFIIFGQKEGFDFQTSDSKFYEDGKSVLTHTYNYYYHLPLGIGIALTIGFLYIFLMLLVSFRKSNKQINKTLDRYNGREYKVSIFINDQTILYKDDELQMQVSWSVIRLYKIEKDYLILFNKHFVTNSLIMILPYSKMSKDESNELLSFIKKIPKK
jgi:hypothetical protein